MFLGVLLKLLPTLVRGAALLERARKRREHHLLSIAFASDPAPSFGDPPYLLALQFN